MLLMLFTLENRLNMLLFILIIKLRHLGLLFRFVFLFYFIFPLGRDWLLLCSKLLSDSEMKLTKQFNIKYVDLN